MVAEMESTPGRSGVDSVTRYARGVQIERTPAVVLGWSDARGFLRNWRVPPMGSNATPTTHSVQVLAAH